MSWSFTLIMVLSIIAGMATVLRTISKAADEVFREETGKW